MSQPDKAETLFNCFFFSTVAIQGAALGVLFSTATRNPTINKIVETSFSDPNEAISLIGQHPPEAAAMLFFAVLGATIGACTIGIAGHWNDFGGIY